MDYLLLETKEHKEAISKGTKGRKKSKEAIERMAAFHRGKKKSPESIAKRTATRRANGNFAWSQETKDKMVATTKRNKELREKENQNS